MGRGRQKAKHTKVARQLKYYSPDTNYGALERELTGRGEDDDPEADDTEADDPGDEVSKWEEYAKGARNSDSSDKSNKSDDTDK